MTSHFLDGSAVALSASVRAGEVTARAVTEAALDRVTERGETVGAVVEVAADRALAEADAIDRTDGPKRGILAGVPVPIKDLTMVAGVPMRAGSAALANRPLVPDVDDGVVRLLRRSGTTMIAKTATPEFGFPPYTEPNLGPDGSVVAARTPWDLSRGAGGSSGGAAAAVAVGITPLAHGSDGGGSIRIPAASCGVVGMKPSRGVVSAGPLGVDGPGLVSTGVLARTVADAALGLDGLTGTWPGDPFAAPGAPAGSYLRGVMTTHQRLLEFARLRVGVLTEPVVAADADVSPHAVDAVDRAARLLADIGCTIERAPVPMSPQDWLAFAPLWSTGALTLPIPDAAEPLLTPLTRWLRSEEGRCRAPNTRRRSPTSNGWLGRSPPRGSGLTSSSPRHWPGHPHRLDRFATIPIRPETSRTKNA